MKHLVWMVLVWAPIAVAGESCWVRGESKVPELNLIKRICIENVSVELAPWRVELKLVSEKGTERLEASQAEQPRGGRYVGEATLQRLQAFPKDGGESSGQVTVRFSFARQGLETKDVRIEAIQARSDWQADSYHPSRRDIHETLDYQIETPNGPRTGDYRCSGSGIDLVLKSRTGQAWIELSRAIEARGETVPPGTYAADDLQRDSEGMRAYEAQIEQMLFVQITAPLAEFKSGSDLSAKLKVIRRIDEYHGYRELREAELSCKTSD